MKRIAKIYLTDLAVLAALVLLNPLLHNKSTPSGIPDKVEVLVPQRPSGDSATIHAKMEETGYFLRVHNVTDEGYNLIAQYNTQLQDDWKKLARQRKAPTPYPTRRIAAKDRLLPAVILRHGYWKAGHYWRGKPQGCGITRDHEGRVLCALFNQDSIITATRTDSTGTYRGAMDNHFQPHGQGTFDGSDGSHYDGFWQHGQRHGFGFECSPHNPVRCGEWQQGRFLGERLRYTAERIYGIDISRHQHEKGRKRYRIRWDALRITSLGHKHPTGGQTFPVSFVYIKSTEGSSIRNRYFLQDYQQAKRQGIRVGAYHFFSIRTSASEQANYFVNHTLFRKGDFPPVLDIEPTHSQVLQMGGTEEMLRRIRTFMNIVERRTGMRPILYVNQMFVNLYMQNAADLKKNYNVWIARYGEYKPDVKLVYWQLSADGRVNGINGDVDINVFNGYKSQWDDFLKTGFHK